SPCTSARRSSFSRQLDPEPRQDDDRAEDDAQPGEDQPWMAGLVDRRDERAAEQDQHTEDEARADHHCRQQHDPALNIRRGEESHYPEIVPDSLPSADANYTSGDDYVVEFLGYRFS